MPSASSTPALQRAMGAQVFGFAAGHVSTAKSELRQMSCFRWTLRGTREVATVSYFDVCKFLQAEKGLSEGPRFQEAMSWSLSATQKDLKKLREAYPEAIHFATVGPKDLLFTPAGALTFHRVFADQDVLGVRCGLLCGVDGQLFPKLLREVKALKANTEVLDACCALMASQPELFILKQKTSAEPPAAAPESEAPSHAASENGQGSEDDVLNQLEKLQQDYQASNNSVPPAPAAESAVDAGSSATAPSA